jgi:hypothetical protein
MTAVDPRNRPNDVAAAQHPDMRGGPPWLSWADAENIAKRRPRRWADWNGIHGRDPP